MKLVIRTRGDLTSRDKEKVLLAIASDDIGLYADVMIEDLLKAANVAVYYPASTNDTKDGVIEIDETKPEEYLEEFRLIIFPVTMNFLEKDNPVRDQILPYVIHHKAYIPIILERDLLESFGDHFGDIQFLDRYGLYKKGENEIPYEEKLKLRMSEVITSDSERDRIDDAFRAMIFLSYRKIDRVEAQKLMNLLHSDPDCEDIAIWYDEYLVPGEDFNEAIRSAMDRSDVIALNVTNNLLEITNGKPNYVMDQEYPNARRSQKPIISVEMEKTDKEALREHYEKIDDSLVTVDEHDKVPEELKRVLDRIRDELRTKNADKKALSEEEKEYYLGLAYLGGVNTEKDQMRSKELLERSANQGLARAMKKLSHAYRNGDLGDISIEKSAEWMKEAVENEAGEAVACADRESFELFREDCLDLWDMYDSIEDDTGRDHCKTLMVDAWRKLRQSIREDMELYEIVTGSCVRACCRRGDTVTCREVLQDIDLLFNNHQGLDECKLVVSLRSDAAYRMGDYSLAQYVGGAMRIIETEFGDSVSDDEMYDLYYLMTRGYSGQDIIDGLALFGTSLRVSEEYLQTEYLWWDSSDKAIAITQKCLADDPEDTLWKKRRAEILMEKGNLISRSICAVQCDLVDKEVDDAAFSYMNEAIGLYKEIIHDIGDKNEIRRVIEEIKRSGFFLISNYPERMPDITGVEFYRYSVELAESLYKEEKSRENLLFLWETVSYCCEIGYIYDLPDKAIAIAKELYESDHTLSSYEHVAKAYELKATRGFGRAGELEYEIATNEAGAQAQSGDYDDIDMESFARLFDEYIAFFSNRRDAVEPVETDFILLKREGTEALSDAVAIYREVYDKAGMMSERYRKKILGNIISCYRSFEACADVEDGDFGKKALDKLAEGMDFILNEASAKDTIISPDWFKEWRSMYNTALDGGYDSEALSVRRSRAESLAGDRI